MRSERNYRNNSDWDPFFFFMKISFLPALILTIIFIFLNIKTIFWSEHGTFRHPGGYVGVSLWLWIFTTLISALLYVIYFLLKIIREKPTQRKTAARRLLIFLGDQLLILSLFIILIQKKEWGGWRMLPLFYLITLNGFFIHYFFSRPAMKLLRDQYPYYFPKWKFSSITTRNTMGWAIVITLIIIDFQILSLLFCLKFT